MARATMKKAVAKADRKAEVRRKGDARRKSKGDAEKALIARFISPTLNHVLWVESPEEEVVGIKTRTKPNTGFAVEFKGGLYEIPNAALTSAEERILLRVLEIDVDGMRKQLSGELERVPTNAEVMKNVRPLMNERFILWMTEHDDFRKGFHPLPARGDWWEAHEFFRKDTTEVLSPTKKARLRQDERDKIIAPLAETMAQEMTSSELETNTRVGANT